MGYTDSLLADGEVVAMRSKQHPLALFLDGRNGVGLWLIAIVLLVASVIFNIQGDARNVLGVIVLILFVVGFGIFIWHWIKWINQDYVVTNRRILKVSGIINKKSMDSSLEKINDLVLEENLLGRMLDYGDLDIVTASDVAIDQFRMLRHAKDFKKEMLDQKHSLEQGDFYRPSPPIMASSPVQAAAPVASDPVPTAPAAPVPTEPVPVAPAPPPVVGAAAAVSTVGAASPVATEPLADETAAESPAAPASASAAIADEEEDTRDVTRTLARLADLRDSGAITSEEYEAKKAELLGRL